MLSEEPPLLSLRGVTKKFGGITALNEVDFELRRGEIHALVGENGAGKSTLIKVLGGIHTADHGTIWIDGEKAQIRNVADADRCGVRIIHQELSLAPNLSIAENIYLGREPSRLGWLNRRKIYRDAGDLVETLGLDEIRRVSTPVSELSVAHRQLVEIARALSARARILVLDEPTSSLSEAETEALFSTLRRLREQEVGIIYISHRLEEIIRLADRITVLRDGHSIGTQLRRDVNQRQLVRWMVGREMAGDSHRPACRPGEVALEVRDLRNENVHGVSLSLRYGEILGLAGLVGHGRSELARAIFGIDKIHEGTILVDGRTVSISRPRDALRAGIVLVPEDRKLEGLVMQQSVAFNIALPWLADWISWFLPDWRKQNAIVDRAVRKFAIKIASPEQVMDELSGGNQQKVLVSRWLERPPKILILDEPTRGVDVGARLEMFDLIGFLAESGLAVLLISSDLSELLSMSHRIAVYRNGCLLRTASAGEITLEEIMHQLTEAQSHATR